MPSVPLHSNQSNPHARGVVICFPDQLPRRDILAGLDPTALKELLDMHFGDNGGEDGSSYRRLYGQSLAAFLQREGRSAVEFAERLENVDAAVPVVESLADQIGVQLRLRAARKA
jgi:hypothetical protein